MARAAGKRASARRRTAEAIATTPHGPRALPELVRTRPGRAPSSAQVTTDSGLTILAVRRASSPMVEARLRIPFGSAGDGRARGHAARAELLAETVLLGTHRRRREDVDAELAVVGGHLSSQVGPQRLLVSGSVLSTGLDILLEVLADSVTDAAYRSDDVARERDRLVEHLVIAASQPSTVARQHLQRLRFGEHPAAWEMPEAADLADVTAVALRSLHRRAVVPAGSTLVLVGDLRPAKAVEQAALALDGWRSDRAARELSTPPAIVGGPLQAFHRAGSVQSQVRLTSAGIPRGDAAYPAAQLANIVFGGYFSSRLVENLREDKGFTYHASSTTEFWPGRAAITIGYDTTTDATAASIVETRYELGRIAATAPTAAEIDAARNYAIGSLASSLASQAGYASMLSTLIGSGLDGEWLRQHPVRLAATTDDEVAEAAQRLFAPEGVAGIIVGDLDVAGASLRRLGAIEGL